MVRKILSGAILLPLLFCLILSSGFAQSNEEIAIPNTSNEVEIKPLENSDLSSEPKTDKSEKDAPSDKSKYLPSIGFGPGLMTFLGDVKSKKTDQPIRYRMGYGLNLSKEITPFLEASLFALSGDLYGNRRDTSDNYNFRSRTFSFGLGIIYNFYKPFYKKTSRAPFLTPFIGLGFEMLNFETKSDMIDGNGQEYHYWKDGSIRDRAQTDPGSVYANSLLRDYNYETPLTQGNTFAIPVMLGVSLNISPRFNLNLGSTYHIAFTDKLDGINLGSNDNFLFSSATLKFNLGTKSTYVKVPDGQENYSTSDFLAVEKEDLDGDGIKDMADKCAGTPQGVQVDEFGCPLDDDKDGVPNYIDLEANTPLGSQVDEKGLAITDEYIDRKNAEEEAFMRGTNAEKVIQEIIYSEGDDVTGGGSGGKHFFDKVNRDGVSFKVQLGKYKDGIPPDQVESFMHVQDITSYNDPDGSVLYIAGGYGTKLAAESRRDELKKNGGIKDPIVIAFDKSGKLIDANSVPAPTLSFTGSSGYNLVFKVQLGAFMNKIPASVFDGIDQLSKEESPNGATRYLAGSYSNYNDAVSYRNFMKTKGFADAFVVAFRDNKRIDLGEAGSGTPSSESNRGSDPSGKTKTPPVFKIQIGLFKNEIPEELQKQYSTFRELNKSPAPNNLNRYTAGSFASYEEAVRYKEELIGKGVKGAFVISFIGERIVPLSEALRNQ